MTLSRIKRQRGITLIELLVSMSIFVLTILVISGIFTSVVQGQRRAIAMQNVQQTGAFLIETLSKQIRMSTINTVPNGNPATILSITTTDETPANVSYVFENNQLVRQIGADQFILSPSNLEVTGNFYVTTSGVSFMPKVTIALKIKTKGGVPASQAEIYLQNTITSRAY